LCPHLGNYALKEKNSIVVLDNAKVHLNPGVVEAIHNKGAIIVFLPKYSPDLNPIECLFSMYKAYLKKHSRTMDKGMLHLCALRRPTRENMIRIYKNIDYLAHVIPTDLKLSACVMAAILHSILNKCKSH
jgi:transposase